jgi:hypothetical protein
MWTRTKAKSNGLENLQNEKKALTAIDVENHIPFAFSSWTMEHITYFVSGIEAERVESCSLCGTVCHEL